MEAGERQVDRKFKPPAIGSEFTLQTRLTKPTEKS